VDSVEQACVTTLNSRVVVAFYPDKMKHRGL